MTRIYLACVCLLLLCCQSVLTLSGETAESFQKQQKGQKKDKEDVNLLSMEVHALETLRNFKATVPQLQRIAQIAKATKAKVDALEPAKAGADYVGILKKLRVALIANNEDEIEKSAEELEKIVEKNSPELDDEVDITDAARKEAEGLYHTLSPRQLVLYADSFGDDFPEPVQLIVTSLAEINKLTGKEWEEARDDLASEVSWLVAGLNGSNAPKIRTDVAAFLNRQHGKSSKASELEPRIRQLIGPADPAVLLRNVMKHDLALLLSNPQVEKAARELLKK